LLKNIEVASLWGVLSRYGLYCKPREKLAEKRIYAFKDRGSGGLCLVITVGAPYTQWGNREGRDLRLLRPKKGNVEKNKAGIPPTGDQRLVGGSGRGQWP